MARVVQGELSLAAFEDWIDDETWNMHSESSPRAADLVSSIHLLLSERDDAVIDENDLQREFEKLLNNVDEAVVIEHAHGLMPPRPHVSASTDYSFVPPKWVFQAA